DPPVAAAAGRLHRPRLAVLRVAQHDGVHVRRHARAHNRLAADVVGPLEHVEGGSVVVRLGEQRRLGLGGQRGHPFTDPAVSPCTMKRCRNRNRITTGTAAIRTPAANGPQCCENCWSMKPRIPSGSVNFLSVWRMTLAMMNSFNVPTKENSAITARTGAASGSTTPQNTCAGVAPSTRADSSSSLGIVSKKPFMNHVFTPIAPPRYTTISAVR